MAISRPHLALLADEQILVELGRRFEQLRQERELADRDLFERGGVKKDALAAFKKGRNVSLLNVVKIMRGAGLLDELERLFPVRDFSPLAELTGRSRQPRKRVVGPRSPAAPFVWQDESDEGKRE